MLGKKTIQEYRPDRESVVLDLVKQYPFYSLDKLIKELPGVSRHSVQNILEKNNLSTIEKRLAYSSLLTPKTKNIGRIPTINIKGRFEPLALTIRNHFQLTKRNTALLVGALVIITFSRMIYGYILAPTPEILLDKPSELDSSNKGEKLFVLGKVVPRSSHVSINGKTVALNGDGSFTAIVSLPMGESTLELTAANGSKKASILRLVTREATETELKAKAQEDQVKKNEAVDKAAEVDRTVNDLIAAKNAGKKGALKVVNNKINEQSGFSSVIGEIINLGKDDAGWVTVSVSFYTKEGNLVETKYGFVSTSDQTLKAGQTAGFETQSTTKPFDHYSLDLSWEPVMPAVAGASTTNATDSAVTE